MSNIPGLLLCPVEPGVGELIKIPTFTGTIEIPESHKYGNCRRASDFEKMSKITEGTFMCRDKRTNEIRTLKRFKIPSDFQKGVPKSILREFNILNSLNHINVIKSYGPATTSILENNCFILDYCRFSLKDLINEKFPIYEKSVVKCIIQQLFQGLDYIHSAMVIHRMYIFILKHMDINSENIVFDEEGILKITGFQCSRFYNQGTMSPVQSELRYQAPELLLNSKTYDTKVDMWSAGCLLAELVMMKPLFTGGSEIELLNNIIHIIGTPSENVWPGFDELFVQFKPKLCLQFKPEAYEIRNSALYSNLKNYITEISAYDIIKNLLIYFPKARFSANECVESTYFKENPPACSVQHLASILKNGKESAETSVTQPITSN